MQHKSILSKGKDANTTEASGGEFGEADTLTHPTWHSLLQMLPLLRWRQRNKICLLQSP